MLSVFICISIACFNSFGVAVTKNASAAQRSTIDTSRTVLIWIFCLAVPMYGERQESFKVLQLFGFIFLVFGTLVYNEILVLPFLGFNLYTKEALKQRDRKESKMLLNGQSENPDYSGMTPHTGHDAQRFMKNIEKKKEELVNRTDDDEVSYEEQENRYK